MSREKYYYVVYVVDGFLNSIVVKFEDEFSIAQATQIAKSYSKGSSAPIISSWQEISLSQFRDYIFYAEGQTNKIIPKLAEVVQIRHE